MTATAATAARDSGGQVEEAREVVNVEIHLQLECKYGGVRGCVRYVCDCVV